MIKVDMVHSNFYKVTIFETREIIGCISSFPYAQDVFVYFMDKNLEIFNQEKLDRYVVECNYIAEYERFLAKKWEYNYYV